MISATGSMRRHTERDATPSPGDMAPDVSAPRARQRTLRHGRPGRQHPAWRRLAWVLVVLAGACREPMQPLVVDAHEVAVTNTTATPWTDIEIWVNDHYRVTTARLEPHGRFHAPLDAFVAGFGQRFDPRRQAVRGIEVTATTSTGESIRLTWGEGRRR